MADQNNNYSYPPPPVYFQQVPPPENNKGKGCGGCLTGLGVLIVALTIVFLTVFFVVKPQLDQMIADMGGTNIKQLFSLYKEVTTRVDEKTLVTHGFSNEDYISGKAKLLEKNYNIFDEDGNIIPESLANAELNEKVELTDKEFAALLNNVLVDYLANKNIPIYSRLKLDATAKEIKINSTLDSNKFKITVICSVNTDGLTSQMGILGGLIPGNLYLTSQATYSFNDDKLTFSESSLKLNKIKDSSFQELLNIINKAISNGEENMELQELSDSVATLVCDGINAINNYTKINVELNNGGIELVPKPTSTTPTNPTEPEMPTEPNTDANNIEQEDFPDSNKEEISNESENNL